MKWLVCKEHFEDEKIYFGLSETIYYLKQFDFTIIYNLLMY